MMTHIAWDRSAIHRAINEVFGMTVSQKTTKTLCGKRVSFNKIDNFHPVCPDCQRIDQEEKRMSRLIVEKYGALI
jgi:Protein of unknown function (DUF3039).